jgi:hypothetical protein
MRASQIADAVAPTDQVRAHELTEVAHSYPSTNLLKVDRGTSHAIPEGTTQALMTDEIGQSRATAEQVVIGI